MSSGMDAHHKEQQEQKIPYCNFLLAGKLTTTARRPEGGPHQGEAHITVCVLVSKAPEGARLSQLGDGHKELFRILPDTGDVIRLQPLFKHIHGEQLNHVRERDDTLFRIGIEQGPVSDMLFRPEEVHGASGIWKSLQPVGER